MFDREGMRGEGYAAVPSMVLKYAGLNMNNLNKNSEDTADLNFKKKL